MTGVKDFENGWKLGIEASYNGKQYRLDYSRTPSYLFTAAMISKDIGKHFIVVLNGENLLDYRQSKKEALYSGN
ncbi:hypothetical protein, partial [Vibrio parahaemolyticus]